VLQLTGEGGKVDRLHLIANIIGMTNPPDPSRVLADLEPIASALYEAVEVGAGEARAFFARRNEPVEPFHFASTVRYVAKGILTEAGVTSEIALDDLANNGLSFRYGGYNVRVRKADDGRVPVPGGSRTLQLFYQQNFGLLDSTGDTTNLIVLWDVVRPQFVPVEHLVVACPRSGGRLQDSVSVHWQVALPNPAYSWEIEAGDMVAEQSEGLALRRQAR
jgi:hypothetical protein